MSSVPDEPTILDELTPEGGRFDPTKLPDRVRSYLLFWLISAIQNEDVATKKDLVQGLELAFKFDQDEGMKQDIKK
jgi:hypothetical protein